jgi:hypothetical protein
MVDSGDSGASSWMHEPDSPTAIIASPTPCSSLTSSCVRVIPYVSRQEAIPASRSRTATPTWSIAVKSRQAAGSHKPAQEVDAG